MNIVLLDSSNNTKEVKNIIKPKTYQALLEQLKQKFPKIQKSYELYILDERNKEIIIDDEEKYKIIEDIIFIREIDENNLEQSLYEINYNKLSESKQIILDEKYNCILCSIIIKNENPYLCYKCQKIFHEKCLKDWDQKCKQQNKILLCPNFRNELPIENWNKKLDFEENRNYNTYLMNEINKLKDIIKKKDLIEKYEKYIKKTIEIFKNILNKINSIHSSLNFHQNEKLINIIDKFPLSLENVLLFDLRVNFF